MSPLKHTIRPLAILATVAINAYFAFRGPQLALVSYTAMVVMIVLFLLCCYMEYCIYKDQKFIAQANLTVVEAQRVLAETLERTELERLVREVTRNN
jgi:amino acid permease